MQKRLKSISSAILIGVVSIFLLFSGHTDQAENLTGAGKTGDLRFIGGELQRPEENKICLESGMAVLTYQPCRAAKCAQRTAHFAMAGFVFALFIRRRRTGAVCLGGAAFLPAQFLCELLIRLEKDGKKRLRPSGA